MDANSSDDRNLKGHVTFVDRNVTIGVTNLLVNLSHTHFPHISHFRPSEFLSCIRFMTIKLE